MAIDVDSILADIGSGEAAASPPGEEEQAQEGGDHYDALFSAFETRNKDAFKVALRECIAELKR